MQENSEKKTDTTAALSAYVFYLYNIYILSISYSYTFNLGSS